MFKKLKDKIAEEVKSSPQRIQQRTPAPTRPGSNANPRARFSNVSLSNYSTPQSSRVRKNSNSSVASDMSFLPRYKSSTNLYHLQSDLDVSASELEDNASTSSQLGHLTKEQIYAAFQKSQSRYHKYRGRYTDIANHYRELERENVKMKSVLVETQDKALRRVAELREQCSLEQKAKAHLENALRLEIDEKQYIIDTLKTKVDLLQNKGEEKTENDASLNLETLTKDLKDAQIEIESLNERLQEHKANAIVFNSKESDLKNRIKELDDVVKQKGAELADVLERERENNLIIAQTKMELHTEIQNRDLEIENLKQDVEALKSDLDQYENRNKSTKLENLQSQNTKLIEKIEELSVKCKGYESELLKLEQAKIENVNKIEEKVTEMRELEERHRKAKIRETVADEFRVKEEQLRGDYESKLQQLAGNANNFQEIQVQLLRKEDEVKDLSVELVNAKEALHALKDKHGVLESGHLELISENGENMQKLKVAMKECEHQLKERDELHATELAKTKQVYQKKLKEQKTKYHDEMQTLTGEVISFKEQNTLIQTYIDEYKEKLNEYETVTAENAMSEYGEVRTRLTEKEGEIVHLQNEIGRLQQNEVEHEEVKVRLIGMEQRVERLLEEIDSKSMENQELQKRLSENENQIAEKVSGLDKLKTCLIEKEQRLLEEINSKSIEVEEFQKRLSSNEAEREKRELNLKTCLIEKEQQVERLLEEINSKSIEVEEFQKRLSSNEAEREKRELNLKTCLIEKEKQLASLEKYESEYKEERVKLVEEIAQLITSNDDLQAQIVTIKAKESDLYNEKLESEQELIAMKSNFSEYKHMHSSLKNKLVEEKDSLVEEVKQLQLRNNEMTSDYNHVTEENENLLREVAAMNLKHEQLLAEKEELTVENAKLRDDHSEVTALNVKHEQLLAEKEELALEITKLRNHLDEVTAMKHEQLLVDKEESVKLQNRLGEVEELIAENTKLKAKLSMFEDSCFKYENDNKVLQSQVRELEHQYSELVHERQLLHDEVQELKIAPININNNAKSSLQDEHEKEINHLNEKIVQYKSLDLTNRTSIQFYENELQKLKNKNEKLNRKLDETLVTLNHCTELTTTTETEYLRNVLFNYMLGKESLVLARVIAAVCKFDDNQTEAILQREQQKQTLETNAAMDYEESTFIKRQATQIGTRLVETDLKWKHATRQIFASAIAIFGAISSGINLSYSSIMLPQLYKGDDIPITKSEASWIASLVTISLPIGTILTGVLMDRFGRKTANMFSTIPFAVAWVVIATAPNVETIYFGRLLAGIGGGLTTASTIYVSEITHPNYRPMLLNLTSIYASLGILVTNVLGYWFYWRTMGYIFIVLQVITLALLTLLPESPYWLVVFKDNHDRASRSIRWIYKDSQVFDSENRRFLTVEVKKSESGRKQFRLFHWRSYTSSNIYKPFLILTFIFIIQQLTGAYVIIFYATDFFSRMSKNTVSDELALVLLGVIRFITSVIAAIISKKIGRKVLLFIRVPECACSCACCVTCVWVRRIFIDSVDFDRELLPVDARGKLGSMLVGLAYLYMFGVLKVFPYLLDVVRLPTLFCGLAVVNCLGICFVQYFLPETLGKRFSDIEKDESWIPQISERWNADRDVKRESAYKSLRKRTSDVRSHLTFIVLGVAWLSASATSSAIPMWELLSKEEKLSYLYSMFAYQVEEFCEFSETADCNRDLLKYGLGKLKSLKEEELDSMDPYQRGADGIIWNTIMEGRVKHAKTTTTTTTAKPNSYEDDLSIGVDDWEVKSQYFIKTGTPEYVRAPLSGPVVVRVHPDGTPIDARFPQDDDLKHYEMSRAKLPTALSGDVPKNVLEDKISAHQQKSNGSVYDKKPFKITLEAGKKYFWCLCGKSKNQPFCDGTHKDTFLKIKQRSIKFEVTETKDYWLCQCKHTNMRPFCDGTHKTKVVQDATSTIRQ
ncbi:hypothetical protein FQR65_LT18843 [Abscondita terminalis]|nr:hypothetical protein FQR65_LT18843 [Abscondita terminalis]